MALRPTGVPRSGCKRCGFPGHLTFECRNVINTSIQSQRAAEAGPANPLQKVIISRMIMLLQNIMSLTMKPMRKKHNC